MDTRNRTRSGFTLIELLVVIGIVAVVAAILFPVFGAVRERGRRTSCQSNLKQIAIAMQQYVQDNEGTYPTNSNWCYAPYSYLKNVAVFRCPEATDLTDTFTTDAPVMPIYDSWNPSSPVYPVDYSYNAPRLYEFSHGPRYGKQEAVLATPATIFLNMDISWRHSDGSLLDPEGHQFWRMASTSCGQNYLGSTLHSGAGNYSYVDGHVKWLTPEEAGEIDCANGPLPAPLRN